jgi:hypothetical protein
MSGGTNQGPVQNITNVQKGSQSGYDPKTTEELNKAARNLAQAGKKLTDMTAQVNTMFSQYSNAGFQQKLDLLRTALKTEFTTTQTKLAAKLGVPSGKSSGGRMERELVMQSLGKTAQEMDFEGLSPDQIIEQLNKGLESSGASYKISPESIERLFNLVSKNK